MLCEAKSIVKETRKKDIAVKFKCRKVDVDGGFGRLAGFQRDAGCGKTLLKQRI